MPLRALYLDDEPELCEIFLEEFASDNFLISVFTDADKAIESARDFPPDLIFLDYRLPRTNGDKVAFSMPSEIPKYLITGESNVPTQYKFEKIFGKPFDRERIREVFEEALKQKK